jgi:heat shock protein HslJ
MKALRSAALLAALAATATTAEAQNTSARNKEATPPPPQSDVPQPLNEKQFPLGAAWLLVSLNGKSLPGERPSFTLDKQFRARGFSGCNTFATTALPLRQQRFAVGPFALTKKACDKGLMESEKQFLTALRTSVQWDLVAGALVIKTQNGELKFERTL